MTTTVDRRVIEIDVKTARSMQAEVKRAGDSLKGFEEQVSSLKSMLGGLAAGLVAGFSAHAFVSGIKSSIDAMDEIGKRSQRIGVATEALSALTYQADLAGIEAGQLDTGLGKLNKNLAGLGTESNDATKALARLGVVAGSTTEQALEQIAEQFAKMPDGVQKTAIAMEIFGKAGAQLIPMLNEGKEGMIAAREEAERLGIVIGSDAAKAAEIFNDNMTRLKAGVHGAMLQIAQGMLPALAQITDAFQGSTETGERFKSFGEGLGEVIKWATGTFMKFSATVEALGKGLGAFGATVAAIASGNFRGVLTIWREFANDVNKIEADVNARLIKLGGPGAVVQGRKQGTAALAPPGPTAAQLKDQKKAIEETNAAWVKMIDQLIEFENAEGLASLKTKSYTQLLEDQQKVLDDMVGRSAAKKWAEDIELLTQAFFEGTITLQEFDNGMKRVTGTQDKALDANQKTIDSFLAMGEAIQQSIEGWSSEAADAILDFVTGVETSVSKMVEGILRQMAKLALQKLLLDPLFSTLGKSVGSIFGPGAPPAPSALGNVFGMGGQRLAFASGGVVSQPTAFGFAGGTGIMGEAGPEAIMPLSRGADGSLGVDASGAGVTINVFNESRAEVQTKASAGVDGKRMVEILVRDAVANGFRSGAFDGVMGATYGLNRTGAR